MKGKRDTVRERKYRDNLNVFLPAVIFGAIALALLIEWLIWGC